MEDYKEKYKAAIERAKEELGSGCFNKGSIEYIFPELKDNDERIRKAIIAHMHIVKSVNGVDVSEILAWLEKVKDFDKQLEEAYKNSDEVQYKRGYEDGYLEGIGNAKKELEKQGEHANFLSKIQVGDKVTRNEDGVLVNLSQLNRVVKKLEKQDEQEQLTHSQVTKKSEQDGRWKWDEDDEKFFKENILIKLGNIDSVSPELYSKIIDWINLIKKRLS